MKILSNGRKSASQYDYKHVFKCASPSCDCRFKTEDSRDFKLVATEGPNDTTVWVHYVKCPRCGYSWMVTLKNMV